MTASRGPLELLDSADEEFARRLRLVGPEDRVGEKEGHDVVVESLVRADRAGESELELGPHQRAFAPTVIDVAGDASPQDQVLHRLGRQPHVTEEVR